jgi:hypothetical protein
MEIILPLIAIILALFGCGSLVVLGVKRVVSGKASDNLDGKVQILLGVSLLVLILFVNGWLLYSAYSPKREVKQSLEMGIQGVEDIETAIEAQQTEIEELRKDVDRLESLLKDKDEK